MNQSWSIVVFCYNEVGTIKEIVELICSIFDTSKKGLYEVVIVDDGSTDGSVEKIDKVAELRRDVVKVVKHVKNKGIGETLHDGYLASKNENLTAIPADGQFNVRELVPYMNIDENTFVSFYRLENVQYTTFRNFLSFLNKGVNKILNGMALKDVNWVKIYKTKAVQSFDLKLRSSLIESEICAKLLRSGYTANEVLSYYHPRVSGVSKGASFKIIRQALRETAKLIWVMQRFHPRKSSDK